MWEKNRVPTPMEIDSYVFREEKAAETYALLTEGKDVQLIRHYVWEKGLTGKESGLFRKLYSELGLSDTALAQQEKVKVRTIYWRPV